MLDLAVGNPTCTLSLLDPCSDSTPLFLLQINFPPKNWSFPYWRLIQIHMNTPGHTHIFTHRETHIYTQIPTHIHRHTLAHRQTNRQRDTHTHTHQYPHRHTGQSIHSIHIRQFTAFVTPYPESSSGFCKHPHIHKCISHVHAHNTHIQP